MRVVFIVHAFLLMLAIVVTVIVLLVVVKQEARGRDHRDLSAAAVIEAE